MLELGDGDGGGLEGGFVVVTVGCGFTGDVLVLVPTRGNDDGPGGGAEAEPERFDGVLLGSGVGTAVLDDVAGCDGVVRGVARRVGSSVAPIRNGRSGRGASTVGVTVSGT